MAGSNPFDEWVSMVCSSRTRDHATGTCSTSAVAVTVSTTGWWAISADVDFWLQGPATGVSTVTSSTGNHVWAKDTVIRKATAGDKFAVLSVSGGGDVYADRIKGE